MHIHAIAMSVPSTCIHISIYMDVHESLNKVYLYLIMEACHQI